MGAVDTAKTLSQKLTARVQTGGVEIVSELAEDWRRLCDEDPAGEVFYRPEWIEAHLRVFVPTATVIVISVWAGERLRGVLPLMRERTFLSGMPVVRLLVPASIYSCRAGLVHSQGDNAEEVLRTLWHAVKELRGWDVIDVSYVLEGNGLHQLTAIAAAEGFPIARKRTTQSLYLPIASSAQGGQSPWLAGTRPKFRANLRRFSLDFLELNGKPIAAHFGLNFRGRYYLPKAGYDEAYHRQGPGQLLTHEVLTESSTRGLCELDFVGPGTWDESRWASARRTHFRIFIFRKGLYGRLLHAVRIPVRDAVKALLKPGPDENAPLPLLGQPQGAENDSGSGS